MIQENIKKIEGYFKSIEINNGIAIVKVEFKEKWGVYPSEDEKIKVVKSKDTPNEWMYYANYNEVEIDDIFNLIDNTIKMNIEAGLKIDLLSEKFEELKTIFSSEKLERLKTLTFVFQDVNVIKPRKRKYIKKADKLKEEKLQNTVEQTTNVELLENNNNKKEE